MHIHSPGDRVVVCRMEADQKIECGIINSQGIERRRSFSVPYEVLDDPSLNRSEKRAILAEWASNSCAVKSFPALRRLPGTTFPVTLSSIMDALAQLDDTCESQAMDDVLSVRAPVVTTNWSRRASPRAPLHSGSIATT